MKKIFCLLLVTVLSFTLVACGNNKHDVREINCLHSIKKLSSSNTGVKSYGQYCFENTNLGDLSNELGICYSLTVSDKTIFEDIPREYNRDELIEWGKNPGLGVDILHKLGYAGKGSVVAYVDQPISTNLHEQYDNLDLVYTNTVEGNGGFTSMHGPAVLSLLAGKDIGIIPDSKVYFYSFESWKGDQQEHANRLYDIVELNKSLPEDEKITMVAFSDIVDKDERNGEAFIRAIKYCEENDIMVWLCDDYQWVSFIPMSDRNNINNVVFPEWGFGDDDYVFNKRNPPLVYVPGGSRTVASEVFDTNYTYWSEGGLSWTMPYMTGLYSIMKSIDTSLSKDEIKKLVVETAYNVDGFRVVNPIELIAVTLENVNRQNDADKLREEFAKSKSYDCAIINKNILGRDRVAIRNLFLASTGSNIIEIYVSDRKLNNTPISELLQEEGLNEYRINNVLLFGFNVDINKVNIGIPTKSYITKKGNYSTYLKTIKHDNIVQRIANEMFENKIISD